MFGLAACQSAGGVDNTCLNSAVALVGVVSGVVIFAPPLLVENLVCSRTLQYEIYRFNQYNYNEEVILVVIFVMAEQEKRSDMYFVQCVFFSSFFLSSLFDCRSFPNVPFCLLCVAQKKNEGAESYTT